MWERTTTTAVAPSVAEKKKEIVELVLMVLD